MCLCVCAYVHMRKQAYTILIYFKAYFQKKFNTAMHEVLVLKAEYSCNSANYRNLMGFE